MNPFEHAQAHQLELEAQNEELRRAREELQALHESEERFRLAIEATSDGIWDWNVVADEIFFSAAYARMLGYEPGAFPPRPGGWAGLVYPEDREHLLAVIQSCIDGPAQAFSVEHRISTREGALKWVLGRGQVVSRDERGRARRLTGTIVDVTERRTAEEARRVSEQKLETIFQLSPDAIDLVSTTDRVCLELNQAFTQLFGYAREEFVGKPLLPADLDPWVDLADRDRLMAGLRAHGVVLGFETPHRRKDGSVFLAEISAAAITLNGKPCHLSFTRDITRRRQAEEERLKLKERLIQAQKMEALGVLTAGVAHHMNNVLAVILGTASLREAFATVPLDLKAFQTIGKAAERGRDVVQSLIHFAQPARPDRTPCELNRIAREAAALLGSATRNRIRILADHAAEPLWILGDAGSITRALVNLSVNAIEAMPEGGTLTFRTAVLEADWVEVSIQDDGTGMDPEVLPHVMEPFYTTKAVGAATGLGLSITYGVVKAHDGAMDISSQPGLGTTVNLRFPRLPAPPPDGA